jgi:hypothetical protein
MWLIKMEDEQIKELFPTGKDFQKASVNFWNCGDCPIWIYCKHQSELKKDRDNCSNIYNMWLKETEMEKIFFETFEIEKVQLNPYVSKYMHITLRNLFDLMSLLNGNKICLNKKPLLRIKGIDLLDIKKSVLEECIKYKITLKTDIQEYFKKISLSYNPL